MTRISYAIFAPRERWLAYLAAGWQLPFVVEPAAEHHGHYAILLTRDDAP